VQVVANCKKTADAPPLEVDRKAKKAVDGHEGSYGMPNSLYGHHAEKEA
jgi:hypothetical protein